MTSLSGSRKMRLFQTTRFPPDIQACFDSRFDIAFSGAGDLIAQLDALPEPPDALLCSIQDARLSADVIHALPSSVRAIATYSVGLDHIDLDAAAERGIAIFSTRGALEESVADVAMFLLLGAIRRGKEALALIGEGRWKGWSPDLLLGLELSGRTLGILGLGAVGEKVAVRAAAFGMRIAYCNRRPSGFDGVPVEFEPDPDELFKRSDVFLLACPSTAETRRFLNRERLAMARPHLVVVNVGRGDLVDDDALIEALETKRIFAAGLDVFNGEPDLDPRYKGLANAFCTPHIGSSTIEARLKMAKTLVDALAAWKNEGESEA